MRDFSELRRYVSHLPGSMRSNYEALMESGLLWQVGMQRGRVGEKKNEVVRNSGCEELLQTVALWITAQNLICDASRGE